MKSPPPGRLFSGASAIFFGVLCLMWHDAATWQNLHHLWSLPLGVTLGACLMAAQIAGGVGIQFPRMARPAAIVLGIVYLSFSLACIPDIVAAANTYDKYGGSFFLFLSLFFGAIAVYVAAEPNVAQSSILGRVARIGLGICAISFALGQGLILHDTASAVPKWIPPNPMFWAILTTAAFALAAIAILINRHARLAMRLMTFMVGLFGVLVWIPHLIARPHRHFLWSELAETFLVTGAAWVVGDLRNRESSAGARGESTTEPTARY